MRVRDMSHRSTSVRLRRAVLVCALAALAIGAGTKTDGDKAAAEAQKLADRVVYRQKGLSEKRAVELMGAPTRRAATDGGAKLTWGASDDPCAMTATFRADALTEVTLVPGAGAEKKACKQRAKPLLDIAPGPGSPAVMSTASFKTLTNDSIVEMVKEGRPPEAIIALIKTEPCAFDVSIEATMTLRRDGVKESVIQAMIDRDCH